MLSDLELREKIQYRRLLERSRAPSLTNLDLRTHRFQAVRRGEVLGYYSSLALACATVDGVMNPRNRADLMWEESNSVCFGTYVLDIKEGVYYTHKLRNLYPAPEPEEQAVETAA